MLFTATSANTSVSLTGTAGFQYIGLDNVSVIGLGVSAVPEPGGFALICAGLPALLFGLRRRRRS
jgi:hypothetical protein